MVARLRRRYRKPVRTDDYAAVLKVWVKRYRDPSRARKQVACWMHAVLCQLIPGGGKQADHRRPGGPDPGAGEAARPAGPLAAQLLTDLRSNDIQRRDTQRKLDAAVHVRRLAWTANRMPPRLTVTSSALSSSRPGPPPSMRWSPWWRSMGCASEATGVPASRPRDLSPMSRSRVRRHPIWFGGRGCRPRRPPPRP